MKLRESDWLGMKYRHLILSYDAHLLESWDHTAMIACQIYNLMIVTGSAFGSKGKMAPRSMSYFNPYRKPERKRNSVSDINDLKLFARGSR